MGALSTYLSDYQKRSDKKESKEEVTINILPELETSDSNKIVVEIASSQKLRLFVKTFNLETNIQNEQISLNFNESGEAKLDMIVTNPDKPYIVVLSNVDDPNQRWEAVGAKIVPKF
jgi:P pilus assembly chaperone PapD